MHSCLEGREKCILKFAPKTQFYASSKCDASSIPATNSRTPGEDAGGCKVKYPVDVIWSEVSVLPGSSKAGQEQKKKEVMKKVKRKREWKDGARLGEGKSKQSGSSE